MENSVKAPKHLSPEARRWWRKLQEEYVIEDAGGLLVLLAGLEAFDAMRNAQKQIAQEGACVVDRFGQPKPHPATVIERDSRAQLLGAIKQLCLDLEPLRPGPGRPPGR